MVCSKVYKTSDQIYSSQHDYLILFSVNNFAHKTVLWAHKEEACSEAYWSLQRIHLASEMYGENFWSKVAITTLNTNWTPNSACKTKSDITWLYYNFKSRGRGLGNFLCFLPCLISFLWVLNRYDQIILVLRYYFSFVGFFFFLVIAQPP